MRILLLTLLICPFMARAGELTIRTGHPGAGIKITTFEGLQEHVVTGILTGNDGSATYRSDYSGFLLVEIGNTGIFPVILNNGPVVFSFDKSGFPHFSDAVNTWLYDALGRKKKVDEQRRILRDATSFFSENDPFHPALKKKEQEMEHSGRALKKDIAGNVNMMAATLIRGQLIIDRTYGIKSEEDLKNVKKEMLLFLSQNQAELYHSDMFRQMAFQYAMMNEYVAQSREEHYALVLSDIGDWIAMFRGKLSPEEITAFYTEMAAGRRMISLAVEILGKFGSYAGCPVDPAPSHEATALPDLPLQSWKSDGSPIPLSSAGNGNKLLVFYDEACVFSLPGHVRVMALLEKNGLSLPVITIFAGKKSSQELDEQVLPRKITYWYRDDPGSGFRIGALLGIRKYPAFVIVDPENRRTDVYYTGDAAIQSFSDSGK
jgi:hypothetical protein